jgi:hypothetical protein
MNSSFGQMDTKALKALCLDLTTMLIRFDIQMDEIAKIKHKVAKFAFAAPDGNHEHPWFRLHKSFSTIDVHNPRSFIMEDGEPIIPVSFVMVLLYFVIAPHIELVDGCELLVASEVCHIYDAYYQTISFFCWRDWIRDSSLSYEFLRINEWSLWASFAITVRE